jgi:hypothetical protein
MTRRRCECLLAFYAVSALVLHAAEPNLSGTWHLNVEKSVWGRKPKPQSVVVTIEHTEPTLKYSGVVTADADGGGRPFEFRGAFDGKEYAYRDGTISLRRIDAHTTTSVYKSSDGAVTETARTTLSRDGRTLTRVIEGKGSDGRFRWTEVYERH